VQLVVVYRDLLELLDDDDHPGPRRADVSRERRDATLPGTGRADKQAADPARPRRNQFSLRNPPKILAKFCGDLGRSLKRGILICQNLARNGQLA
jgi:hypothetical protein